MKHELFKPQLFNGFKVIVDDDVMSEQVPYNITRGFFERLFSLTPFNKFKTAFKTVPKENVVVVEKNRILMMHSTILALLEKAIDKENEKQ
jgi:hypothetical protein